MGGVNDVWVYVRLDMGMGMGMGSDVMPRPTNPRRTITLHAHRFPPNNGAVDGELPPEDAYFVEQRAAQIREQLPESVRAAGYDEVRDCVRGRWVGGCDGWMEALCVKSNGAEGGGG